MDGLHRGGPDELLIVVPRITKVMLAVAGVGVVVVVVWSWVLTTQPKCSADPDPWSCAGHDVGFVLGTVMGWAAITVLPVAAVVGAVIYWRRQRS